MHPLYGVSCETHRMRYSCGYVYNRLKKNRVTRGLPTSFHSIQSKGDSDKLSNMVTLIQVGYNKKKVSSVLRMY